MKDLSIDIETYSSVDITKSGLYKYVNDESFEVLLLAYSVEHRAVPGRSSAYSKAVCLQGVIFKSGVIGVLNHPIIG